MDVMGRTVRTSLAVVIPRVLSAWDLLLRKASKQPSREKYQSSMYSKAVIFWMVYCDGLCYA